MKERDVFVLMDQMAEAGQRATSFVEGMQEDEFLADGRTQQAVAMSLIIIGEAATRLERIPQKLADFYDKNALQYIDFARFLIARTIPFERKARLRAIMRLLLQRTLICPCAP
jgi:uncharacterized protein with HEPN domain